LEHLLLIRYGEIYLKGQNRPFFENLLLKRVREAVGDAESVFKNDGRFYVQGYAEQEEAALIGKIKCVFGLHSLSPAIRTEKDFDTICAVSTELLKQYPAGTTFKVEAKRSDKRFRYDSMEIAREAGAYLLEHTEGYMVDVHHPAAVIHIEIRDAGAYCYTQVIPCAGGMPVGCSGKAMLLLSGGIDSPVAGYMIAKRGVVIEAVHYYSFPYTGEKARQKVIDLAKLMSRYTGPIRLHIVHFTDIQTQIYEKCPQTLLTLIMRRYMMRIAEELAQKSGAQALVTGESIGQVASQTMESLVVTDGSVSLPVFRPVIGMDKVEIMDYARKIGTYETSILPYEDCCTVFVAKHPSTKPRMEEIEKSEGVLDAEAMIADALNKTETLWIQP
jgi:thiamine biosynthesis protein ThiI